MHITDAKTKITIARKWIPLCCIDHVVTVVIWKQDCDTGDGAMVEWNKYIQQTKTKPITFGPTPIQGPEKSLLGRKIHPTFPCEKSVLSSLFCPIFLHHWKESDESARRNRSKMTASLAKTLYTTDMFYSPCEVRPKISGNISTNTCWPWRIH